MLYFIMGVTWEHGQGANKNLVVWANAIMHCNVSHLHLDGSASVLNQSINHILFDSGTRPIKTHIIHRDSKHKKLRNCTLKT